MPLKYKQTVHAQMSKEFADKIFLASDAVTLCQCVTGSGKDSG